MDTNYFSDWSHRKVWSAYYTDEKTEIVEIRTHYYPDESALAALDPENRRLCANLHKTMFHKEKTIGTALADFLYADFSLLDITEQELPNLIQDFQQKRDLFSSFQWLFVRIYDIVCQSGLFAPLAASLHRLHLDYTQGRDMAGTVQTIHTQIAYYKELRPKLARVVDEVFVLEREEDMVQRYFQLKEDRSKDQPAFHYPDLAYGPIAFQPLTKDANGFFPYDNLYDLANPSNLETQLDERMTGFYGESINTEDPQAFVAFVLTKCLQHNVHFRSCKFCHRYFAVTGNPKTQFCNRRIEGSRKTCKEMGASRIYTRQTAEQDVVREFRRSYKTHNARVRYGMMTREEFSAWSQEARRQRDLCLGGQLPYDRFVAWLDSDRQK